MPNTKANVRAALDQAQEEFERLAETLQPSDFPRRARPDEWTILQYVAHIARAEYVHLNLARLSLRRVHLCMPRWLAQPIIRSFNGLEQQRLRSKAYNELLAYQQAGRTALLQFIEQSSDAQLEHQCFQLHNFTWAPLSTFYIHVAEHQSHHVQDIRTILQRTHPV